MKNIIKIALFLIAGSFSGCATAQSVSSADTIADKMLIYQLSNGGWPKQLEDKSVVNYEAPVTAALKAKIAATPAMHATIDNNATSREIKALVKAYQQTHKQAYLKAAERGLDYLFEAQYANGGWPQYYPDKSNYRAEITYNDNAIINVMNIMQDIVTQSNDFDVVDKKYVPKAILAVKKGLDCILKTQVMQNGKLTIWAAQYNEHTLKPAKARAFEPAALSTSESVGIVKFLMRIDSPSTALKTAVNSAVNWFNASKINGYKFEQLPGKKDRGLIADPNAVTWARFYDLNTNEPLFGDRDNKIYKSVAEISFERRNGYAWYGIWPKKLINKAYPKWQKTWN